MICILSANRWFTNFRFKASATPPQNEYLNAFWNDMYEMIRNIEFFKVRNDFQDKLRQVLQTIRSSKMYWHLQIKIQTYMTCSRGTMRNCYTIVSHKHIKRQIWMQSKTSIENWRNLLKTSALKTACNTTQIAMRTIP